MKHILEQIKDNILPLIMVCAIIAALFSGISYGGKTGVFAIVGNVPSEEITDTQVHETPKEIEEFMQVPMPEIIAQDAVYKTQTPVVFSSIFTVKKDGLIYNGTQGVDGGFKLVLTGVTREDGTDALQEMTIEEYENIEEVTFSCVYDKQKDLLLFVTSGVYKIHITCILENGASGRFFVTVPVEAFYNM